MGRPLLASVALHFAVVMVPVLLALRGPSRAPMPPVYAVSLVSGATVAPEARRPEPQPEEAVEENEPPEPEAKEKVPDAEDEREPEKASGRPGPETPRPGPATGREAGPDLPFTLEGRPFPFSWYLGQLVNKIERNWRPTSNTMRATVYFRIARNGRITDIKIAEESGNFLFDQSARRAVEASAPMPPLPDEYDGDYLGVYFDFDTNVQIR